MRFLSCFAAVTVFLSLSVLPAHAWFHVPTGFTYLSGKASGTSRPMLASQDKEGAGAEAKTGAAPEAKAGSAPQDEYGNVTEEEAGKAPITEVHVADPLEKWNRFWFTFNDKLYFWVLKPVAKGYGKGVPEGLRIVFNNFYRNVSAPIRIVNNLLQFKMKYAGTELLRLTVNSTMGFGGLKDCATECFGIGHHDNDFGLTLAFYHVGPGLYLVWPVIGPSTARDTVGIVGDLGPDPIYWYVPWTYSIPMRAHDRVNFLSFHLGDYEALRNAAVDPYVALRNAYMQNRAAALNK